MNNHYNLIKKTRSLCPISKNEIDAKIIKKNNTLFMEKIDNEGKLHSTIINKNYDLYKLITNDDISSQITPVLLKLYISSKCNLNCSVCYEANDIAKEPSIQEIEKIVTNTNIKHVVLMGREPTCRKDLFEIIKVIRKHKKFVYLLTNGIKISDKNYLNKLIRSGIDSVTLSLNGFNDSIYKKMNGESLLKIKLQALENLKHSKVRTIISTTLARETNENQIQNIIDYCFNNRFFVDECRIRAVSPMGKYLQEQHLCLSDIMDIITNSLKISKDDIYKQYLFLKTFSKILQPFLPGATSP